VRQNGLSRSGDVDFSPIADNVGEEVLAMDDEGVARENVGPFSRY
jgi:hypothetical protein